MAKPRILYHRVVKCWLVEVLSRFDMIAWAYVDSFDDACISLRQFYAEHPNGSA